MALALAAPFTETDLAFSTAFNLFLGNTLTAIENSIGPPLVACVTLWIIIQGVLVMRGDIDTRRGITKIIMVALVVGLVDGQGLYETYVETFFESTVPAYVSQVSGTGAPVEFVPEQLDAVFDGSQVLFQLVAVDIPPANQQDTEAFEAAQWVLFATLWAVFGISDTVNILTSVLIAIGPLILVGYLFDATRSMTEKWIGQLVTYAILLLLLNTVATIVLGTEATAVVATTAIVVGQPVAAQIIGLYELDMFFATGDALILALPAIAALIGGGVGFDARGWTSNFARHIKSRVIPRERT